MLTNLTFINFDNTLAFGWSLLPLLQYWCFRWRLSHFL